MLTSLAMEESIDGLMRQTLRLPTREQLEGQLLGVIHLLELMTLHCTGLSKVLCKVKSRGLIKQ